VSEYQRAILRAVALGPEPLGWYKIEQRLSREALNVREYLPDALAELERGGYLTRHPEGSVSLTEQGREASQG
jgi:Mn-dependent DtxR family transcriptional regulator